MQQFEFSHPSSSEVIIEEPEPLPTTEEALRKHLQRIEALWSERADALRHLPNSQDRLDALRDDLYDAYDLIDKISDFLAEDTTELSVSTELLEAAKFELGFSRQMLSKVLK